MLKHAKLRIYMGSHATGMTMGFMLILGTLLWWGEAAYAVGKSLEAWWNWREALVDFTWVIECMIRTVELGSASSTRKPAKQMHIRGMEAVGDRKSKVFPSHMFFYFFLTSFNRRLRRHASSEALSTGFHVLLNGLNIFFHMLIDKALQYLFEYY